MLLVLAKKMPKPEAQILTRIIKQKALQTRYSAAFRREKTKHAAYSPEIAIIQPIR